LQISEMLRISKMSPKKANEGHTKAVRPTKVCARSYATYFTETAKVVTYNIVKNGAFKGGAISPGLQMRFRAMNDYTSALPLVEGNPEAPILGTSTEGSLQAGVNVALAKEVEGMSAQLCHEFDLGTVVICGGDRNALRNHLKKHIFAPSNYELHALKRIHEYFKNQGLS
ncbi:MAG: type III pantothenate kinase, partial [Schleiferiaceae bacterium]